MHMRAATTHRDRRPAPRWWVGWLVTLGLASAPGFASPFQLEVSPSPATWADRVRATVSGSVSGGCGASLGTPNVTTLGPGHYRIDLPLNLSCVLPTGTYYPFEESVELGVLEAGSYRIRLSGSGAEAEASFVVYEPGSAVVEVPAVSTSAAPGVLTVATLFRAQASAPDVRGNVLELEISAASGPTLPLATLQVPLPPLSPGHYEIRGFSGEGATRALVRRPLRVWNASHCIPDGETLCLNEGRFRVRAGWQTSDGQRGAAHPVTSTEGASGLLWFFGRDNAEITIKVLEGCALNGHWWVFLSAGSNVGYDVEVTDTTTGAHRTYHNALGTLPPLVADASAFPCGT